MAYDSKFLIELDRADRLQITPEGDTEINEINTQEGVRWLISFLNMDNKRLSVTMKPIVHKRFVSQLNEPEYLPS